MPKNMLIKFMQYTAAIINQDTTQGRKEMPLVLPLCLYRSVECQRFKHPTMLAGYLVNHKHRDETLLGYGFKLVDLTIMTDEEISTHGHAALMKWLLRDAYLKGDMLG
ncbi:MAG: Rpn family recombination-promoting nuclease/putative transposase [Candidatus Symbiodolus clandestinus]